ncbi:MAG: hypothetical protein IJ343_05475 [Clostridia bacterium]|nr:hypothetical protein [Clostridia bacterium]
MNDAIRKLDAVLAQLPFDPEALETLLTAQTFPPETLHDAAMRFIMGPCMLQPEALNGDEAPADTLHCAALPQVLEILLQHGMDPDRVVWDEGQDMIMSPGEECLLTALRPIEWGDVAARCVRLLLEAGADPRLELAGRGDPFGQLWGMIDEAICEYDACPDSYIRQLMVMLGYGASDALEMTPGSRPEELRRFEDVTWTAVVAQPADEYGAADLHLNFFVRGDVWPLASY